MFSYLQSLSSYLAFKVIGDGDKGHLVDVREYPEFSKGHASGSVSIPLGELSAKRLRKHIGYAAGITEPIHITSATGMRAEQAIRRLHNIGVKNAVLVNGGI